MKCETTNRLFTRLGCGATFCLAAALCHGSRAQEATWAAFSSLTRSIDVEGVTATVPMTFRFRIHPGQPASTLELAAEASLADFQAKLGSMLEALARSKSDCGTRWSFPRLDSTIVEDGHLRLSGAVRVEQWLCSGPLKTRLGRETADFTLAVTPRFRPREIAVDAALERFDLGDGLLADLGLGHDLKAAIERELDRALERPSAKLAFPDSVAELEPRFTGAGLEQSAAGAVLAVEAQATIEPADLPKLSGLLRKGL